MTGYVHSRLVDSWFLHPALRIAFLCASAIVVRLSRVTDATTSPERQIAVCRELCTARGYEEVGIAQDLGVSAGKTTPFDRPQLGKWLSDPSLYDALPTEGTKEERMKATFEQTGIPATPKGEAPAMIAFAVCLQRKAASHDDVVASLHNGDLSNFTTDQVEAVVSISEQIWCSDTPLK